MRFKNEMGLPVLDHNPSLYISHIVMVHIFSSTEDVQYCTDSFGEILFSLGEAAALSLTHDNNGSVEMHSSDDNLWKEYEKAFTKIVEKIKRKEPDSEYVDTMYAAIVFHKSTSEKDKAQYITSFNSFIERWIEKEAVFYKDIKFVITSHPF